MSHSPAGTLEIDVLATTRAMPADLILDIPILMVNRQGATDQAYMRTENFLGHCAPGATYRVSLEQGFVPAEGEPAPMPSAVEPAHVVLDGQWDQTIDITIKDANILGGNGRYQLPAGQDALVIPVAETTAEHLAFYGSRLIQSGDLVRFESSGNLPVTVTAVGEDYPEHYLLRAEHGGGAYLEVHDRPHFHMPLTPDNSGYLILGKQGEDGIKRVSAFHIPYGYGIQMGAWAIHSDAYIIGRHLVIYSATPEFSTVILRDQNNDLAAIEFQ